MNAEKYMEERVDQQINWYNIKAQKAQNMYKIFQIIEIILAALIPLLAGYTKECEIMAMIVGVLGAGVAIIESICKINQYQENWIRYRCVCELLQQQKYLYLTETVPYNRSGEDIDNVFVQKIENIIALENSQWKTLYMSDERVNDLREEKNHGRMQ